MSRLAWPLAYPAAWLWRRTWLRRERVVAITGSFGKTSTAAATAAVFATPFDADRPNYGAHLAAAVLRHRPRRGRLVLEVAISRPGQMRAYARMLRPDVVVLTAIGNNHLVAFGGDIEALAREKARLPLAVGRHGTVVVNGDDARCRAIGEQVASTGARVERVGYAADCDWRIERSGFGTADTVARPLGGRITLRRHDNDGGATTADRAVELATPWIGDDLGRCVAFAAAAGFAGGVDAARIADRLAALPPLPWRLEARALPGGATVVCDAWKGSWETIDSALREMIRLAGRRRVAVLGAIEEVSGIQGERYKRYGQLAAAAAERILFVGSERDFERFRAGVRQAAQQPRLDSCSDVGQAALALRDERAAGTVVLVKGRHAQKLGRIAMLLRGEAVDCNIKICPMRGMRCEICPRVRAGQGTERKEA
jgi:UDP-N-acetylmuramoyl-tripeptide--D-alanyl-D-alanine ligase